MTKYVFCVDVGTTSMKACIFDSKGTLCDSMTLSYDLITEGTFIETDPEIYVEMMMTAYRKFSEKFEISAVSMDTQGETMILVDKEGKPLRRAIVWLDDRASAEAAAIREKFGEKRVYEVTGQSEISAGFPAPKILWIKNHEPEVFAKIHKVLLLEDWLMYRLTGSFDTERTLQSSSLYLNISTGEYWQEMLDFIGLPEEKLPALHESGEKVGEYRGAEVYTGALDQIAGMLGAGTTVPGVISEMTGTTMAVAAVVDHIPAWHEGMKIPCHYISKGKFCRLMWSPTAGIALEWFRDQFAQGKSFREIDEGVANVPAGCEGLVMLPYLCGSTMPIYNPGIRGVFWGMELKHTSAHFARAIMESVACMLREYLEYMEADVKEIRSIGGGANSKVWLQMKANITGKTVKTLVCSDVACLGCALLALGETGDGMIAFKSVIEPTADESFVYEQYHKVDLRLNIPSGGIQQ
ncbi:MAG: hypothetical protein MJ082_01275 [Clostridia bacterium]|nr:hypothetical protein [Clostridia bacterium]